MGPNPRCSAKDELDVNLWLLAWILPSRASSTAKHCFQNVIIDFAQGPSNKAVRAHMRYAAGTGSKQSPWGGVQATPAAPFFLSKPPEFSGRVASRGPTDPFRQALPATFPLPPARGRKKGVALFWNSKQLAHALMAPHAERGAVEKRHGHGAPKSAANLAP